jgi:hypothetical protein
MTRVLLIATLVLVALIAAWHLFGAEVAGGLGAASGLLAFGAARRKLEQVELQQAQEALEEEVKNDTRGPGPKLRDDGWPVREVDGVPSDIEAIVERATRSEWSSTGPRSES